MKVFVTGASGFVGSAVVAELLAAGHHVLGLARSDSSAAAIAAAGAEVHLGSLEDLDSLRRGADTADGVIHTAFIHNFADLGSAAEADRRAIEVLGEALVGSDRPLVVTSGIGLLAPGRLGTEEDTPDVQSAGSHRAASEAMALSFAARGVRVALVRLPPTVHGAGDHGFVPVLINIARTKGISAYPLDGANRWSAVHRLDAAHLYRLALENAAAGSRLHGVAEEGVPVRDIAQAIANHLNIPTTSLSTEETLEHFGWLGRFFSMDIPASSALTQQRLGWQATHPTLLADLAQDFYFTPPA